MPSTDPAAAPGAASFTPAYALSERALVPPNAGQPERKRRVVVTGGSGNLGRWVVREMVEAGWQVFNLDVVPPLSTEPDYPRSKARYMQVDLTDYGQVLGALSDVDSAWKGVDAVIHLAAIPAPAKAPNHVVFHTNITQTYNILEASRVLGITNLALASSETVFGLPLYPHLPTKLPVTEEVERPESSYSLSKLMGEKMAEQHCRWNPAAKVVNIRLSNVMQPGKEGYAKFRTWQDDPWERAWNGFCYIDARDCAQAFRLAIEKENWTGAHVFNIANADIAYEKQTTAELVKLVFPGVPYTPDTDDPREGLISIKKAREVLGFEPRYSWLNEV